MRSNSLQVRGEIIIKEEGKFWNSTLLFFVLLSYLSRKEACQSQFSSNWARVSRSAFVKKKLCEIHENCDCSRGIFINFPSIALCFSFLYERVFFLYWGRFVSDLKVLNERKLKLPGVFLFWMREKNGVTHPPNLASNS